MKSKQIKDEDYKELLSIKRIYTFLDKLEQRISTLEKEIIKAIRIESKLPFYSGNRTEKEIYSDLSKFVKKLFKEYRQEKKQERLNEIK